MKIFYIFSLLFGIFVFVTYLKKELFIKQYKAFNKAKEEESKSNIANTQEIFEKNDKLLFYIHAFDQKIQWKILLTLCLFGLFYLPQALFGIACTKNTLALVFITLLSLSLLFPAYLQKFIIDYRVRKIGADIPMFIDLLAVCVQSGMSIETAIKFLESKISQINKSFSPFLNKLILKIEVSGLESAIADLQKELPSREIGMMCSTLKQSSKYGSQIYDSLMNLSTQIREDSLMQSEEIVGKLSAKMSIPLILFFMFPVIIIIAAPGVMRVLGEFL